MREAANGAHNKKRQDEINRIKRAKELATEQAKANETNIDENKTPPQQTTGSDTHKASIEGKPRDAKWITPNYTQSKLRFSQTSEAENTTPTSNATTSPTNRYEALIDPTENMEHADNNTEPSEPNTHKVIKRLMNQQHGIQIKLGDFCNLTEHEAIEVLLHQIINKVTTSETTIINKERMVREWRFKTKLKLLQMANEPKMMRKAVKMIQFGTDQGTSEMEIKIYNLRYLLGTLPEAALEENDNQIKNIKRCIEKYAERAYGDYMHEIQPIMEKEMNIDTLTSILTEAGALPKYLTGKGIDITFKPPALISMPDKPCEPEPNQQTTLTDQHTMLSEPTKIVQLEYKTVKMIKTEEGKKAEMGKMLRQYLPQAMPINWQAIFHHIMGLTAERISQIIFFPGEMEEFIKQNYPNNITTTPNEATTDKKAAPKAQQASQTRNDYPNTKTIKATTSWAMGHTS